MNFQLIKSLCLKKYAIIVAVRPVNQYLNKTVDRYKMNVNLHMMWTIADIGFNSDNLGYSLNTQDK